MFTFSRSTPPDGAILIRLYASKGIRVCAIDRIANNVLHLAGRCIYAGT